MRLRLRIERNALPPTQALWPVKDAKITIAQLLQAINDVFPLEADTWGLEDYTISVGGYECLHWYEIQAACKDEDEVVIKPLQYVDVRSRTLTGRAQISADGRHLVDGVPFGKPQLKAPVRPEIRIPPRKKRKLNLLEDRDSEGQDEEGATLMLTENGEADSEDDDEEDDDFDDDGSASEALSNTSADSLSDSSDDDTSESDSENGSESDSDNDDETWEGIPSSHPSTPLRKSVKSPTTNGSAKSTQDKQSKVQAELDRIQRELAKMDAANAVEEDLKRSKDEKKRKRQQEEAAILPNEHSNKKARQGTDTKQPSTSEPEQTAQVTSLPFQGSSETKKRNARRKSTKMLKHLIRTGVLPESATLASLQQIDDTNATVGDETVNSIDVNGTAVSSRRERVLRSSAKKPMEVTQDPELETQRQKLLSDIASGGVDVTPQPSKKRKKKSKSDSPAVVDTSTLSHEDEEPPSEEETPKATSAHLTTQIGSPVGHENADPALHKSPDMTGPSTTPRSRLNLDASKRLVFGSLGVRTPKTQEEKDQLQKKLADRASRKINPAPLDASDVTAAAQQDAEVGDESVNKEEDEVDDWRSKISLTAVECCDEGVTLSTPPFPFHQRWDPQYRKQKAKKRVNGKYMENSAQKRKHGREIQDFTETYDKYNINGEGDALDYDEAGGEDDDEYWEEGALLNGASEYEDDESDNETIRFPTLPKDISTLATLEEPNANQGDFITFSVLTCDVSTNWQPKEIQRLAQILAMSKNGECWMQLSPQDIKRKVFDENGDRVYSKFEMPGEDEEEEDDGTRTLKWEDMGVVRLVQRPEEVTKSLELGGGSGM